MAGCERFVAAVQAPKPSPGPHKTRDCLPVVVILRNRLKCVLALVQRACISLASSVVHSNALAKKDFFDIFRSLLAQGLFCNRKHA